MPWDHSYKTIMIDGYPVDVDVDIVDLVKALNELDLKTHMSCQDNTDDHRVWICFYVSSYATRFLELVAAESETLQGCVLAATTQHYDTLPDDDIWVYKDRWWVDCFTHPFYADERDVEDGEYEWQGDIVIRISVRFPRAHLDEVTRVVQAEASRLKEKEQS